MGLIGRAFAGWTAGLLATAPLMPGALGLATIIAYLAVPDISATPQNLFLAIVTGAIVGLAAWFLFAVPISFYTSVTRANPALYGELSARYVSIDAQIEDVCSGEGGGAACNEARRHRNSVGAQLGITAATSSSGSPWATGIGYVNVRRSIHAAEQALIGVLPKAQAVQVGLHDISRLTGSKMPDRDRLVSLARVALARVSGESAPYLAETSTKEKGEVGAAGPKEEADDDAAGHAAAVPHSDPELQARAVLREIRETVDGFRDDQATGLVRIRRRLSQTAVFTGVTGYIIVVLAVIANLGHEAIVTATFLYLVAALVGLFQRLYTERGLTDDVEDYGLSTTRLLSQALLSGLAGVGGVVLSAMLLAPPFGLSLSQASRGPSIDTLTGIFNLGAYPLSILVAAIFGLTPGLFLTRLRDRADTLKENIKSSEAGGASSGSTGSGEQEPEGSIRTMARRDIVDAEVEEYAALHSSAEPAHLLAVAESTREFSTAHSMMVGRLEGRFLKLLVAISGARSVLEIGTFTGYSALSMAEALPAGGRVVTCELSPDHAAKAQAHIDASPYADRIEYRIGPALDTIGSLPGPFDLVFIDADKGGYHGYYEAVLPKLSPSGIIVADNVLWSGRVLDPPRDRDADTQAIVAFDDLVAADPRVECVVLTVRDGVTLIRKRV